MAPFPFCYSSSLSHSAQLRRGERPLKPAESYETCSSISKASLRCAHRHERTSLKECHAAARRSVFGCCPKNSISRPLQRSGRGPLNRSRYSTSSMILVDRLFLQPATFQTSFRSPRYIEL